MNLARARRAGGRLEPPVGSPSFPPMRNFDCDHSSRCLFSRKPRKIRRPVIGDISRQDLPAGQSPHPTHPGSNRVERRKKSPAGAGLKKVGARIAQFLHAAWYPYPRRGSVCVMHMLPRRFGPGAACHSNGWFACADRWMS